jgi:hypothetical protein
MEATPETPATGAENFIPFLAEAEPEGLENAESEELSEAVLAVLDFCDNRNLPYHERLDIASALIDGVTQEFEQDLLTYVEETPAAEVDPFIISNTSQVVERLRVVSETLSTVEVEYAEVEDDEFDEGESTG